MKDENKVEAIFGTTLLDASGQPFIVVDIQKLIWTLVNTFSDDPSKLVISPFANGPVGKDQYNFVFEFRPGVFMDVPKVQGWDVAVERDLRGAIKCLYIALSAGSNPLSVPANGGEYQTDLTYTSAIQEDQNSSLIKVWLTTGQNVKLGEREIPGQVFGPFHLNLVQPNTPTLSAPPLAVDFVGRRTVLNDGKTDNTFVAALTNMTLADLTLTPSTGATTVTPTQFTVWFDVVQDKSDKDNAWALTTLDMLANAPLPTASSPGWQFRTMDETERRDAAISSGWILTVTTTVILEPHKPVLFTFSGIKTELDPGFTRMYFRFDNLGSYRPAVLIAPLEKTPLQYGATQGKGLYISAGAPQGDTPPLVSQDSGLYVHQFGSNPAAIFNGGNVGIGAGTPPVARLQIVDDNRRPAEAGTLMLGPGNLNEGVSLRFGCQPEYSWIQSHGNKPLAINPLGGNAAFPGNVVGIGTGQPGSALSVAGGMAVGKGFAQKPNVIAENQLAVEGRIGIGITTPGSSLSVVGGVAIGQTYAQNNTHIAANYLAVEGRIGINTTAPGSSLSIDGGVAIGKSYAQTNTTIPENYLAVEGRVGIGTPSPDHQLHVKSATGIKLSLEGNGGGQLFISNKQGDNTVQLVAAGKDDTPNRHTVANMMWLGGWASPNPTLPKMVLSATEVDLQGDLAVSGSVMVGANKRPLPYGTEKLMIVRGVIWSVNTSNGLTYKTVGTGYTIRTDNNAGKWVIVFDQPFTDMPTVVATPQFFGANGDDGFNTCYLTYMSAGFVTIRTGTIYYGKPAWCDFAFIAIGPV